MFSYLTYIVRLKKNFEIKFNLIVAEITFTRVTASVSTVSKLGSLKQVFS